MERSLGQFCLLRSDPIELIEDEDDVQADDPFDGVRDTESEKEASTPPARVGRPGKQKTKVLPINWSGEDGELLAKCYFHISADPNTGDKQRFKTFWNRILVHYNSLQKNYQCSYHQVHTKRKKLQPVLNEFSGIYANMAGRMHVEVITSARLLNFYYSFLLIAESDAEVLPAAMMNTPIDSNDENSRRLPNLPPLDLLTGPKENYLNFCLPLYQASNKCDWKAAKTIFKKRPELVRYSITRNGEIALHVAASSKVAQNIRVVFVKNLVDMMNKDDMALENKSFNTALYLAVVFTNLETVRIMVEKNRELVTIPGGEEKMLPLYAAIVSGNYDVVKYLYGIAKLGDDVWIHENRGLLFEKCVENNMFDIALEIVKKYPELSRRGSVLGFLAQKPDAFAEKPKNIIRRIFNWKRLNIKRKTYSNEMVGLKLEAHDGPLQLLRFILDYILKLSENEIDNILGVPNAIKQANNPVSGKVDQALELQKLISEHTVNMHVETLNILEQDSKSTSIKGDQAVQIEKVISEHITKMQVKIQNIIRGPAANDTHASEALFTAAEMGNTIFVVELIRRYPDVMWKVNGSNHTIFHIAVENRHEGIYNMLYEIGYINDSITSLEDENGNNMLHLVAKIAKKKKLGEVSGVMLQMQQELLWFKEVESMMNPSCRKRKNKDGLTARELFTKEHEDLLVQSEKWVKETSNQCVVAATLVATIAFAAAITVPGGYKQDNGIPVFYRDTAYTVFILADAISLFASSASIFMFISILISRFTERDFLESIPNKFMILLTTLFYSITTMTISFSASFFVIYHKEMTWIPILIALFAILPVLLYTMLQHGLLVHVFRSTYSSRYQFRPKKHVLFYQNPVL